MKKESEKEKSLAAWGMLSVIVAQLVIAPGVIGGAVYYFSGKLVARNGWDQTFQYICTLFAALLGLVVAFYRINQISNKMDEKESNNDRPNQ